jgi:hypothetical protein
MAARISDEMKKAMDLIRAGSSPAEAAREAGIQRSTISRSRLYAEFLAEQAKKPAAKPARQEGRAAA